MMIDKKALASRFAGYSEVFRDCEMKEDLKAMSYVLANISDEKFQDLIDKEAFRLPGMDKIKGMFNKPGQPGKEEVPKTPAQRSEDIKSKYQEAGPSGKLLTMFDYKDVQNAYASLPQDVKKIVDSYARKWKTGDLVGKSAAEEKEALFEDKSPAGTYKALNRMIDDFSRKYDISTLPRIIETKFNELKGNIDTLEESPERFNKTLSPEEKEIVEQSKREEPLSKEDIERDKKINNFLQVMDKHFKTDLQRSLTPQLKDQYEKMTGDIVSRIKGDIESGFRGSSPGAKYQKKSPYAPKQAPISKGKGIGTGEGTPKAPVKTKVAFDKSAQTSEGVSLMPRMMDIDESSEEIRKLSIILANNKLLRS